MSERDQPGDHDSTLSPIQAAVLVLGGIAGVVTLVGPLAAVVTMPREELTTVDLVDMTVTSYTELFLSRYALLLGVLPICAAVVYYWKVKPRLDELRTAEWDGPHVRDEFRDERDSE
jgi:hypothetical protein